MPARACLFAALTVVVAGSLAVAATLEQPLLPAVARTVAVHTGSLEVDAGQQWTTTVTVPVLGAGECPVLALRAYAMAGGGGCNYVLQVLVNGAPLGESMLRRRLLNKRPWFDPPGTQYHFAWHNARERKWMTMFAAAEPVSWGGTGRDTEFVFDLTGLVEGGREVRIGFAHAMPSLPAAVGRPRAPLVVCDATLGVLSREDVSRLRRVVEGTEGTRPVPVAASLAPDAKPTEPPYEVVWSGRQESPAAQVTFTDLTQWTAVAGGDVEVTLSASVEKRLWRPSLARLTYSGGSSATTVVLRPKTPVPVAGPVDAANLWLFADFRRMSEAQPQVSAYLEDSAGREFVVDLGAITNSYWVLQHGGFDAKELATATWPLRFLALAVAVQPVKEGQRHLYLESLTFYPRRRQPYSVNPRPAKPTFPLSDDGMLGPAPAGVQTTVEAAGQGAVFTAASPGGALRFRVDPTRGLFAGIDAQWQDGAWFQPMAGGYVRVEGGDTGLAAPAAVVSSALADGALRVRWRRGVEWEAAYALRGRSLVVDVSCEGGAATGLRFGHLAGLAGARTIEVPYLKYGWGYGPMIACGSGLFVAVLADWYHCDASQIDGAVPKVSGDGVGLMTGTEYQPLTNGRRNALRDRVLISVSPEFADVLPAIPHPPSPHRQRLAPYLFIMASHMQPTLWRTLKRYGLDHVIACDFAGIFVQDYAEGFAGRWRPHPSLTMEQVQRYRQEIRDLGYLFGAYTDLRDWFPLNEFWDENCVSLDPDGDLTDGWYGNFRAKPNYLPALARLVGEKAHGAYAPDSVYMDTHSNTGAQACDFEAGVPGAGVARDQIYFNAECMLETRRWYGSVISEGAVRWMYAGIADMDYASLFMTRPGCDVPPLVDFDLLRIHPLGLGTMMGYGPGIFYPEKSEALGSLYADKGVWPPPAAFYQYVATSLVYGHMLLLGYGYLPPLSRQVQYYALMQGLQVEYLADTVVGIRYHDGQELVPTSQALLADTAKLGRVQVRYAGGLTLRVNCNPTEPWHVDGHDLPPFGWLATKPGSILAFSAVLDGRRVDYVRCPQYVYLNTGDKAGTVEGIEVQGAAWLKRETADAWRLIPCGDLGPWEYFPADGLPPFHRDMRLINPPEHRGTGGIGLDTRRLLGKGAKDVAVEGRDDTGRGVAAVTTLAGDRLEITPAAGVIDYVLK